MDNIEKIDCTTCKYGYEDERLGIPMCHHPKRFSEDCVDFNMHEEKHLEDKSDESLEEAAEKSSAQYYKDAGYSPFPNVETAAHKSGFIAGAKWQKEQMMKSPLVSISYTASEELQRINYENGRKDMKEQMLKGAVEAQIYGYDDGSFELIASWLDMPNNSIYKDGDKVRIIIVKEEEK